MYKISDIFAYTMLDMKNCTGLECQSIQEYRYNTILLLDQNSLFLDKEIINYPNFNNAIGTAETYIQFCQLLYSISEVNGKRYVCDSKLFDTLDTQAWENMYQITMDQKYKKNTRNFTRKISGKPYPVQNGELPPIFLIPRERGGPSYKSNKLQGVNPEDVQYCPISKGYSMQDLSSFTLGPIVGEGLCLVNAAFSKSICVMHVEGGGKFDLSRKNFWKVSKTPKYKIQLSTDETKFMVNNEVYDVNSWLEAHKDEWYSEWSLWRKAVALCSLGDFHWADNSPTIAYRYQDKNIGFVEWKKQCYIKPSYELLPHTKAFQFLEEVLKRNIPLGLVHPMARNDEEKPITKEFLIELFEDKHEMCCQPFVVSAKLLNIPI